jgi:hypothetical protein
MEPVRKIIHHGINHQPLRNKLPIGA